MIWRITKRQTFVELRRSGKKVRFGSVTMIFVSIDTKHPQVGFTLTKKFGGAVMRNRQRRRLKSAFNQTFDSNKYPLGAYLISASPKISEQKYTDLSNQLESCFNKLIGSAT